MLRSQYARVGTPDVEEDTGEVVERTRRSPTADDPMAEVADDQTAGAGPSTQVAPETPEQRRSRRNREKKERRREKKRKATERKGKGGGPAA